MSKNIMDFKRNDRVQNQFALYFLLDHGIKNMSNDKYVSKLKEEINANDDKGKLIANDYLIGAVDIATEMAGFSQKEIMDFIYDDRKIQKKQERGR